MKYSLVATLILFSISAFAQELFVLKKSFNPKNVLYFNAKVVNCKLTKSSISNHWIMGEERGQREGIIGSEKNYFSPKVTYRNETEIDFTMGALEKTGGRITDKIVRVRLVNCTPKAFLEIDHKEIMITEIYASMSMLMSVRSMKISGYGADGILKSFQIY